MKILEGLKNGDLKGMVNNNVLIDNHKPKFGTDSDTVVLAMAISYEKPAIDLANFLQSSELDLLDVDHGDVIDDNGSYWVYVEFERNKYLYKSIKLLLMSLDRITSDHGDWTFSIMGSEDQIEFSKENFDEHIITNIEDYNEKFKKVNESELIKKRINFMVNY